MVDEVTPSVTEPQREDRPAVDEVKTIAEYFI